MLLFSPMSECPSTRQKCNVSGGKLQFLSQVSLRSQAVASAYCQLNVNAQIAAFAVASYTELAKLKETLSTTISGAQTLSALNP